jgi:hypothetical protein
MPKKEDKDDNVLPEDLEDVVVKPDPAIVKPEPMTYSKDEFVHYHKQHSDLLSVALKPDTRYTITEVESIIKGGI